MNNSDLNNDVNNALRNNCQTSGYHVIDNNNIITEKFGKKTSDTYQILINYYHKQFCTVFK